MPFETIRRQTAAEKVAAQILASIRSGELPPAAQLPAQRDLAERFGVGRSSIREAVNALSVLGHLEVRHGSGTYVREAAAPGGGPAGNGLAAALRAGSILDLMEARELLECSSARLAAERADNARVRGLERALADMAATGDDYARFLAADLRFHHRLAEATGNAVVEEMTRLVLEKVAAHHRRFRTARLSPRYREVSVGTARRVLDGVRDGDGPAAARQMHAHLNAINPELKHIIA